jgi:hypothetical protein
MAVDRSLLAQALGKNTPNKYMSRSQGQRNLLTGQSISQMAMDSSNFGSGQARGVGLAAQLATAGIGAYTQYKAQKDINEQELASQAQFAKQFPHLADIASQLSPEVRQGYTLESLKNTLKANDPATQLDLQSKQLEVRGKQLDLQKTQAEIGKLSKETANVGNKLDKAPAGYRYVQDGSLEAIPGGPAGKLTAESAGKVALIKQGEMDVNRFKGLITNSDGSFNRKKLAAMDVPFGVAGSRQEKSTLFNAVNARLRLESGAAVPEAEVRRAMSTFAPSALDSDPTINSKLERMNEFFGLAKEEIGQGRGAAPASPTRSKTPASSGFKVISVRDK